MKASLFAFVLGFLAVSAFPASEDVEDKWVLVPDVDWHMHLININDKAFKDAEAERADFVVDFILFTRKNPKEGQEFRDGDIEALRNSNFNPNNPTRFICHGWNGDRNSQENIWIRDKYLALGDYNIFVVDWKGGSQTLNYIAASKDTMVAGKQVAGFIDFLNVQAGLNFNTLYLIGHSLGSHVVGIAGKHVTRGKVNTIFGLDAAMPLFKIEEPEKRLAVGDAIYVESIHTNGGLLGFDKPIGEASFYPNWGSAQPGCSIDLTGGCAHTRSCQYFAESLSIIDEFVAEQCKDYKSIEKKDCQPTGRIARMGGEPSNQGKNVIGEYYLPTNSKEPFAIGKSWITV